MICLEYNKKEYLPIIEREEKRREEKRREDRNKKDKKDAIVYFKPPSSKQH